MSKYDIIVIGGGPGGYVAAIRAAQLGAKVALIEKDKIGGTCLNRGCIPTKAIISCTTLYNKIQRAETFGITTTPPSLDLKKVIARKNKIVEKIIKGVEFLLFKNKIEIIRATATALAPGRVEITKPDGSKARLASRKLILATGSSPLRLAGLEFTASQFLSSEQALELTETPPSINIVGGGVIGLEFANIFSSLGSQVTIYEALPDILSGLDEEIVAQLKRILRRKKINILTSTKFEPPQAGARNLICVGRQPNLAGLADLGLELSGNRVKVNERLETNLAGVYAVGDLASKTMLAHVAFEQGVIAAENAAGGNRSFSGALVPLTIYSNPEISSIGLSEKQARQKQDNIKVGKFPFAALGLAQAAGESEGLLKVIADDKDKLLGVHLIGPAAASLIGVATVAVKNGLTASQLAASFQAHPSYPEGLQEAALNVLKQSLHQLN